MGVGKTAVCTKLKAALERSVFLDGDWCWSAHPFIVTEETKAMVMGNICCLLNSFLHCSEYENIIFCWVMHEQGIIDGILSRLELSGCEVKCISLMASAQTLTERLEHDIAAGLRSYDVVPRSLARLPLYDRLYTIKINTDGKSARQIADEIMAL